MTKKIKKILLYRYQSKKSITFSLPNKMICLDSDTEINKKTILSHITKTPMKFLSFSRNIFSEL